MGKQIGDLILAGESEKALRLINDEVQKLQAEGINESNAGRYRELIGHRVGIMALKGQDDEVVMRHAHTILFPSEHKFIVEGGKEILLKFGDLFSSQSDAYVNTIHVNRHFRYSERSASTEFAKKLGEDLIDQQLLEQVDSDMRFVLLKHPQMQAPLSYHIPCCVSGDELDRGELRDGIVDVLKDSTRRGIKRLGFVALGFETVKEDSKRSEIANIVAEVIVEFLLSAKGNQAPDILFCTVSTGSYNALDRAFYHFSQLDRRYLEEKRKLKEAQEVFISEITTIDTDYRKVLSDVSQCLNEDSTILLLGETGVGKSFLAKLIHRYGNRSDKEVVSWNCAQGRIGNLQTQLFGWKKGSYTDAKSDGEGLISRADGGVLFLDEIGYAPIEVQKELLTFVETSKYRRYGDVEEREANVRLIFGTNQDLELLIRMGQFAHDFYERIAQRVFTIPPLRDRKTDIGSFTHFTITQLNHEKTKHVDIDKQATEKLKEYKWRGNVRALKTYLENLYNDCVYHDQPYITVDMIESTPPRDSAYHSNFGVQLIFFHNNDTVLS